MFDYQTADATIETQVVPAALGENSSDEQLIVAARKYARSVDGHVRAILNRKRRVIRDFHKLGEMLVYLYRRRSMGDWGKTLKEIGVSTTTDSYARKFYNAVTFERLDEFSSKTEALEKLGILNRKPKARPEASPGSGPDVEPTDGSVQPAQEGTNEGEKARQPEPIVERTLPVSQTARAVEAEAVRPGRLPAPTITPTANGMLAKVVRALEEVGQVGGLDADDLDLLDRASALLHGLRESVARRVAA